MKDWVSILKVVLGLLLVLKKKNFYLVLNWKVFNKEDYGLFWDEVKNKNCFFWKIK